MRFRLNRFCIDRLPLNALPIPISILHSVSIELLSSTHFVISSESESPSIPFHHALSLSLSLNTETNQVQTHCVYHHHQSLSPQKAMNTLSLTHSLWMRSFWVFCPRRSECWDSLSVDVSIYGQRESPNPLQSLWKGLICNLHHHSLQPQCHLLCTVIVVLLSFIESANTLRHRLNQCPHSINAFNALSLSLLHSLCSHRRRSWCYLIHRDSHSLCTWYRFGATNWAIQSIYIQPQCINANIIWSSSFRVRVFGAQWLIDGVVTT